MVNTRGDAEPAEGSSAVRRRQSSSYEEDEEVRTVGDGVRVGTLVTDDNGEPQRVRFSTESSSRPSFSRAKRKRSDEMLRSTSDTGREPDAPGMNVDNRAAAVMAGRSITGPVIVGLPANVAPSRSAVSPPRTGLSPNLRPSRNRGLSLRSSLFTKAVDRKVQSGDPIIEMQSLESSTNNNDMASDSKKSREPSVTISSMTIDGASSPPPLPRPASAQKVPQRLSTLPTYTQQAHKHARKRLPLDSLRDQYRRIHKYLLRIEDIPPSKDGRHILLEPSRTMPLLDERTDKPYVGNTIRSSKYNAWNFVPRQLFAQFSKLANFYFLIIATLQMIPGLSTTGTYTTIVPLLFFVTISMAKEGYEDLRRYRLDKEENNREVHVLRACSPPLTRTSEGGSKVPATLQGPMQWVSVKWHSLQVGDVVMLERDEAAPADLVLLRTTGTRNNVAYVETMALDGETNLKPKQPTATLVSAYRSAEAVVAGGAHFVVEDPNLDLYNFEGRVTIDGETAPLTNNEIIYRGSVLRNTSEAIAMVIYSGEECKIRMNATKNPRIKAPSLQAIVNKIVIIIVCFVIFLALFNTIAYLVWQETTEEKSWYLTYATVPFGHILTSFIIMFNTMIPLSLYVSLEIIKVAQTGFLLSDVDMYDPESNTPFEPRTSTINEELGQVSYILSDKTGTLTENMMKFRKLSVAGTAWLHKSELTGALNDGNQVPSRKDKGKKAKARLSRESNYHNEHRLYEAGVYGPSNGMLSDGTESELSTRHLIQYIQRRPHTVFARKAKMMILSMALCHTCLPEHSADDKASVSYQASSPDELALVEAARDLGYVAWDRGVTTLTLQTYPSASQNDAEHETFEILDVIEFSSKRKRMSVIVRFADGRLCLITKGADSVLMPRLRLVNLATQKLAEIDKRVNQRRSMEAQEVLRRRSSQFERRGSHPRTSMQHPRTSINLPNADRLVPIRDVDNWLRERERDVSPSPTLNTRHYSPRPSNLSARHSGQHSQLHPEAVNDELVEETLVVDDAAVIERCFQHINDFATEGLRTLLYGYRFLDQDEYRAWKKTYQDATTSLVDRQNRIEQAAEHIEQQLELGGATAIEDKLQKGVPETIDRLRRANIKMWMLTGDKRETAINIGHSCRLIKDYSAVTILDCDAGKVEQSIAASIIDINRGDVAHSVIVVDGQTLSSINADESLHVLFLDLAILADSVICCRASPSQKAGLVKAIRKRSNGSVTLAIGDGANDIAMIQEAHVGIGITGKEGLQAARVSDYSIAQFRFLAKLLLVHGRWNYVRTCKYVVGTFWKEMLFYLTQALYQRWAGYTGTSLYGKHVESWSLSMFNTLFTSLVVIFLGIWEQDLHASTLIAVPELYTKGQRSAGFNLKVYLGWMFMAASQAVIIYFTMWGLYGKALFSRDQSIYPMGQMTFTACVIVIATKLQVIEQRNRTYLAIIAWVLAVGGWFLWTSILAGTYHSTKNPEYYVKDAFFDRFGRDLLWWLTLLLAVTACLTYEIGIRALKNTLFPTDVETFQTLEQDPAVRRRFEEASAVWLQAGWQHGSEESSHELQLQRQKEAQARREGEVQELLDRPRLMEEGKYVQTEEQPVLVADGSARGSTDIQEMLSRRFGSVKSGSVS